MIWVKRILEKLRVIEIVVSKLMIQVKMNQLEKSKDDKWEIRNVKKILVRL